MMALWDPHSMGTMGWPLQQDPESGSSILVWPCCAVRCNRSLQNLLETSFVATIPDPIQAPRLCFGSTSFHWCKIKYESREEVYLNDALI